MHTAADGITAALFAVLIIILSLMAVRAWRRSRVSAEERERRRRSMLVSTGKMGDANLLDVTAESVVYSYAVRGVEYTASQDITQLTAFLPPDLSSLGHVAVRYDSRNPANSIVVAEEWSGLRL